MGLAVGFNSWANDGTWATRYRIQIGERIMGLIENGAFLYGDE